MYVADFSVDFNNIVNNVKTIAREYRHQVNNPRITDELNKFINFMDDVNFKVEFVSDPEEYVRFKMLDAMDYLFDNWITKYDNYKYTETYKTFNSIYDCIKEFYFN